MLKETQMPGRTTNLCAAFGIVHPEPTEQFWSHNAGLSGLGGSAPSLGSAGEGRGGGSYIDDVVLRDRDTDGDGTFDERFYYLQNQHHDVVSLISTSGSVVERINYDPYGSPIGTFTSIANRKGYAGYEYDAELGNMYYVRHRVYRSDLGVWTRRDPLGYVDGAGLYQFVRGTPVIATDPIGLAYNVHVSLAPPVSPVTPILIPGGGISIVPVRLPPRRQSRALRRVWLRSTPLRPLLWRWTW